MTTIIKSVFPIVGGFLALFMPLIPLIIVCYAFIAADCWFAYRLSCRVANNPTLKHKQSAGKINSDALSKAIPKFPKYAIVIILAFLLDKIVLSMHTGLCIANYATGLLCFTEFISILENESSSNDALWARIAKKVLVDKTSRHLDINLTSTINDNGTDTKPRI